MTSTSTGSCSAASARPTRGWPTSGNAWPSPGRSRRVTATAGTGPGLISRPGWPSQGDEAAMAGPPGQRPAAPTCGRPSTSGRRSSSTATTWTGPSCAALTAPASGVPVRPGPPRPPRPRPVRAGVGLPLLPAHAERTAADDPAHRRLRRHRRRAVRLGRARARSRLRVRRPGRSRPGVGAVRPAHPDAAGLGERGAGACSTRSRRSPRSIRSASSWSGGRSAG